MDFKLDIKTLLWLLPTGPHRVMAICYLRCSVAQLAATGAALVLISILESIVHDHVLRHDPEIVGHHRRREGGEGGGGGGGHLPQGGVGF